MSSGRDSDPTIETADRENAIEIEHDGETFVFATGKFVCPECGALMTDLQYVEGHEVQGVSVLSVAVECAACAYDTLHVSY